MFSDTHFHFRHIVKDRGLDGTEILQALCDRDTFFALDIGTEAGDLPERKNFIDEAVSKLSAGSQKKAQEFIYYAAGIWPSPEEIRDRENRMKLLSEKISSFENKSHLVTIGECGLDHHWNPSGVDGRCESDFDAEMYKGERELFEMQLELAKKMNLPVIVHSRDAFEDTLDILKNMDSHNGIIHCYSYGRDEARKFLDLGWHIAFGGGVTYTKKSKLPEVIDLLRFVPDDRLLMETDAPYLAPVPFRGQCNTPVLIEHCYNFVADARKITPGALSLLVDDNIKKLFGI